LNACIVFDYFGLMALNY